MDIRGQSCNSAISQGEEEVDLRRGPWTVEEDLLLVNYIACHGEGRWNALAHCSGLKRTGKSCRLRWLNYLRPDVRRGNITPEEQLLILELHSRWGNRWSKIAEHLPGRTDNEIKNYWRTRVQKQAKQLHCDVNSKQFKDTIKYLWMPRLVERIQAAASGRPGSGFDGHLTLPAAATAAAAGSGHTGDRTCHVPRSADTNPNYSPSDSGNAASSDSSAAGFTDYSSSSLGNIEFPFCDFVSQECQLSPYGFGDQGLEIGGCDRDELFAGDISGNMTNLEDMLFWQQQLNF